MDQLNWVVKWRNTGGWSPLFLNQLELEKGDGWRSKTKQGHKPRAPGHCAAPRCRAGGWLGAGMHPSSLFPAACTPGLGTCCLWTSLYSLSPDGLTKGKAKVLLPSWGGQGCWGPHRLWLQEGPAFGHSLPGERQPKAGAMQGQPPGGGSHCKLPGSSWRVCSPGTGCSVLCGYRRMGKTWRGRCFLLLITKKKKKKKKKKITFSFR